MNAALEYKTLHITKATSSGEFEAVIATLGVVDSDGDIIVPGAFGNATVSIMPAHNHGSVPLGKATMQDRGDKAVAVGKFNLDIQSGKEWHSALKLDLENPPSVQEWSFGFRVLDSEDDMRDGEPVRILKRLDVMEISPVLRGAGVNTHTLAVKSGNDDRTIDEFIQAGERLYDIFRSATPQQQQHYAPRVLSVLNRYMQVSEELLGGKAQDDIANLQHAKWMSTEAAIILNNLDKERFKYAFCAVDEQTRRAASGIAEIVAGELGMDTPVIKFFKPVNYKPDFAYSKDIRGLTVAGDTQNRKPVIYVREGAVGAMINTLAHECRHVWQRQKGWDMADTDRIEDDARAFGLWFKSAFSLPEYANLIVGDGDPPLKYGSAGSVFGLFHYDRKSGLIHSAIGDAPWPRWNWCSTVSLSV